ncbi:MAG: DNA/RNA nuclease SfsA [Planctomycetes bacterium]|nr:DNA/RNA nuclease SfsA [Planctomycetota bacterium]NUQ33595.1 DNA/RNA nuclease SfsA [Planctomycetaceae bacterium]
MPFEKPLLRGVLLKRYKRFLADVKLDDGRVLTVHCPNSGSMKACCEPGRPVIVSDSQDAKRKLRYTWEMIQMGETWVGVNTSNPNRAVAQFIEQGAIAELAGYAALKREVKYGKEGRSRIDMLLSGGGKADCYVEVKNTTMRVGEHSAFPDAQTERGRKHLEELAREVKGGKRAAMFFFVGRADCSRFRPADEIDPEYGALLRKVVKSGVEALAYRMSVSPDGIELRDRLPVDL